MRTHFILILLLLGSTAFGATTNTVDELVSFLDHPITVAIVSNFLQRTGFKEEVLKGDSDWFNEKAGISILTRQSKVWRIILKVPEFKGALPFGVPQDASLTTLLREFPGYEPVDPVNMREGKDVWVIYRKDGLQYNFVFEDGKHLDSVWVQKDAGKGMI